MSEVPKYILDKIQQRAKYQGKANKLTMEIDDYLKKNNIDFEYVCSHIALFCEPQMVAKTLTNKLSKEDYL